MAPMQKVTVRTRSIPRRSFPPELLRSLHALADRMLSEDIEHFRRAFEALAAQNHHRLDEVTGLFAVGIKITEQTLAQYSPAYFDRPEARAYIRDNPGWRDNGYNVGFWFRFTLANLATLASAIVRKR